MIHIHQVQKLTGVTARPLRYYDSIELLKPAAKSEGGHCLYSAEEIKKLQQIQFLQRVGFQLKEIEQMLNSERWNWSDSLKKQLAFVLKERENLTQVEQSLKELINGIKIEGENEWAAIQNILRRMDEKRLEEFAGEDEFINKLWDMRKSEDQSEKLGLYPIDAALLEFMDEAYAIYATEKVSLEAERGPK